MAEPVDEAEFWEWFHKNLGNIKVKCSIIWYPRKLPISGWARKLGRMIELYGEEHGS